MNRTDRHITLWIAALCMTVAGILHSCTDDLGIEVPRPTEVVCFTATLGSDSIQTSTRSTAAHLSIVEEEWSLEGMPADTASSATRATLIDTLEGTAGIIAYHNNDTIAGLTNKEFFFNKDELNSATPIYWKNIEAGSSMDVYAYAPYDKLKTIITGKTFTDTLPTTAAEQFDIIVAKSTVARADFRKTIPLTFTHALTAVRFKLGEDIDSSKVASITINGVHDAGTYTIGEGWTVDEEKPTVSYTTTPGELLMLMPQTLPEGAKVTLTFKNNAAPAISATLKGQKWEEGRLVTYTLHKSIQPTYIYLDLAAGDVTINATTYSGAYYKTVGKGENRKTVKDSISSAAHNNKKFYIYQSTSENRSTTGLVDSCWVLPVYPVVMSPNSDGKTWSEYITNNSSVEAVIEAWDNEAGTSGTVRTANREHTNYWIKVSGSLTCDLTIDNVYSRYQERNRSSRTEGGISFRPSGKTSKLKINIIGDNRLGSIHYAGQTKGNELIFEGTGSLTVADADFNKGTGISSNPGSYLGGEGYTSNHWCAAIGNSDGANSCYGIIIRSGTIFAGTTAAENCSAIGGGGNGYGGVTIEGGTVTAVATTTGTAIGGGIGFTSNGGEGNVTIKGGNVYAYNFANRWSIPSSAIGGAGSSGSTGTLGTVTISGGYVYAYSALGTAIGGGSSKTKRGGDANVKITGGTIIAKSGAGLGIGGGSACTGKLNDTADETFNGGTATITISNNPIVRTGSIGGGSTGDPKGGKIGSANITIEGGDIQAQFILAAGAKSVPKFTMSGGTIRNSNTDNEVDKEYLNIVENGGAVWLEDGKCEISGGTIENCTAKEGGAIYISGTNNPTFIMKDSMDGTFIRNCTSKAGNGGAVYLKGGTVTLKGGTISDNLAQGGNGGGIYIKEGSFFMPTGSTASITENSAILRNSQGGNGGGLYVTSASNDVTVDIFSGSITNNSSDRWGGGACVDMSKTSAKADVEVGTDAENGPKIENNHTLLSGGGLYVSGINANITINGGKIKGNTTSAYVPNVDVANEGGMVTLNEGVSDDNVPCVTVTFHSNDGTNQTKTQKIVTSTNSLLGDPGFVRTGYTLKGWNTRADGNGTGYASNEVMNISEDIDLYAQWGTE